MVMSDWIDLISNIIVVIVVVWQGFVIRKLHRRNRSLQRDLWMEQVEHQLTTMELKSRLREPPPRRKPDLSQISKTTQDVMKRMGWQKDPQGYLPPRIAPPSPGDPQPQIKDDCQNCGRPIMWMGSPNMSYGSWRDHSGSLECTSTLTGQAQDRHVPRGYWQKGDQ